MAGSREINVAFTGSASDLEAASRDASRAVDNVERSASDLGETFDSGASKSAQLAGGLGDLGGALSMAGGPLGAFGSGLELVGPLIMGVTGFMDLASLASTVYAGATRLLSLALAALPFIAIGLAVAALVAGIIYAYNHSEKFREIVQTAFDVVKQAAQFMWDVVGFVFDLWIRQFQLAWSVAQTLASIVSGAFDAVRSGVSTAVQFVTDKVGDLIGVFTNLPAKLAQAASGLWDFFWQGFRTAVNKVIGWWNDFELSIGPISIPFAPDIPKITIGTPNIPLLAAGGIVRRATLAVLGESGPEAVIPLSKMGAAGATYVQIDVHVPPTANPAETGRSVAGALRSYFAAGGRLAVPA